MGRGGYNGGDPAVNEPKADTSHIYTEGSQEFEISPKSRILRSGENLENERGGIQPEFGYIIETKSTKQGQRSKGIWKNLTFYRRRKGDDLTGPFKWIAASTLLKEAPELAQKYHLQYPGAAKPYGFSG